MYSFAVALMGASDAVAEWMQMVVTPDRWKQIIENCVDHPRACDVRTAQKHLLAKSIQKTEGPVSLK